MTDPSPSEVSPPTERRRQPRYTLERKLASWTVVMVTVPTLLCALWLNMVTRRAMTTKQGHAVSEVAQRAAVDLAGKVERLKVQGIRGVIEALVHDKRLAYAMVMDPDFKPIYVSIEDDEAWAAYCSWRDRSGDQGLAAINRPIELTDAGAVIAWKAPIWNPPLMTRGDSPSLSGNHQLEGFVLLAVRDNSITATITQLQAAELAAAGLVCALSMPVVILAVRRWTAPLRLLLEATDRLARGAVPPPVAAAWQDDDLAVLTESFNQMARKLHATYGALEDANAGLERKVEERTAELRRAKRELENEINDKNEFLRAVSHDLGAPLRNIGGMASILLVKYKAALADDAVNKLERIGANVKAQTDLINDLLELSRIRSRPGKRQEVDLHVLVQELVETLAYDLDKNNITLEIHGRLPTILADRNRMRQVFQNLLDNAVKYMLESPLRRVDVECLDQGECWQFTVRDTGKGIDARDLPNIFQLYRRAAYSSTHQVPGRGVGLAGVKTIVETYGGRIWADSQPGKGSAFHFTLDKKLVSAQEPATTGEPRVMKLE